MVQGKRRQPHSPPNGTWGGHRACRGYGCGMSQLLEKKEEKQLPVKHHQVSKVPRGSSSLGWQTEGLLCQVPVPCRLMAPPKGVCSVP